MSRKTGSLRARIQKGECCFGLSVVMPCPSVIELAALSGYDFVRIDLEHAMLGGAELRNLLTTARLVGMPCQIRVPELSGVTSLLGQEPAGIMVPHVESAKDAEKAVAACKFAPAGRRGMDGNTRFMRCEGMSRREYMDYSKQSMDLIVQIESWPALEQIEEILLLDGIDMVATGRADLSQELGVPGQKNHPDVIDAENEIIQKAIRYGKIPTIAVDTQKRIQELYQMGVRCFVAGKDEALLSKALEQNLQKVDFDYSQFQ